MQKQARLFKIDTNSIAFQNIIRCYWVPRLLQKIQESSSSGMFFQDSAAPHQPLGNPHGQPAAAAAPPPPPPAQAIIQSLDPLHVQNQGSEHCISLSESMNVSQICQISEYPTSPFHADYDTLIKGCYYADNNGYDIEAFHLGSMPAPLGNFENSATNSHVAENNWAGNDFPGSMKNMEVLWQMKN